MHFLAKKTKNDHLFIFDNLTAYAQCKESIERFRVALESSVKTKAYKLTTSVNLQVDMVQFRLTAQ